jgi:hypothetical protein
MVVALLLVLLVALIGVTAASETLDGIYRGAVTNKAAEVVSASRAGLDAEVANLEQEATSGSPLTCLPGNGVVGAGSGAANAASAESYALTYYAESTQSPSVALSNLAHGTSYSCATTPNIPVPGLKTWYLALQSVGLTAAQVYNGAKPATVVVEFQLNPTAGFSAALYAGAELDATNDNFNIYAGNGTGDVYVQGSLDASTSTTVQGALFDNGGVTLQNGTYNLGSVVSNGQVTIGATGTTTIKPGGIDAVGAVSLPNNSSSVAGAVYAEDGPVANAGTATGGSYGNMAWPTCPAGVPACSPNSSGPGYVADPPPFPQLTFNAAQWPGYNVYVDTETSCTGNVVRRYDPLATATDTTDRYANGVADIGTYQAIWYDALTANTVVVTPCAVVVSNYNGQVPNLVTTHNLAILAAGGIVLSNNTNVKGSGVTGEDYLYLVTPCNNSCYNGGAGPFPQNGETLADCDAIGNSTTAPNENVNSDGTTSTGDIWFDNTPSGVHTFIYTPDNVCMSSSPTLTGQMFVGGNVTGTSVSFTLTEDKNMSSSFSNGSGIWLPSTSALFG